MSEPVRLYAKQSAASKKCGSCDLFDRDRNDPQYLQYAPTRGTCGLTFPPWMKLLHAHAQVAKDNTEYVENSSSEWTLVGDTDSCHFWRPSALTYVKDQVWSAISENPSKD